MTKKYANLFYFRRISHIGGTEQFLYELAKKYHDTEIVMLYDSADPEQLARLRRLVHCVRREPGKIYQAKRAFYNFNLEALDQVEADEHIFICHAIYQQIPLIPPLTHPKLTRWIGVSEYACSELKRYGEALGRKIEPELCYNPLTLEKYKPLVKIISACRLDDRVKGGQRTLELIKALDKYAKEHDRHYIWHIYTNQTTLNVPSPNVVLLPGRIDIRPFIADADWLVQLSNDMESYCYSINEALGYGTRIVRTPLTVAKELDIPKEAELVCDWEMGNVEEIAAKMFEKAKPFKHTPPADGWSKMLVKKKSTYDYDKMVSTVEVIRPYYDLEREEHAEISDRFDVSKERADMLVDKGFVKIIKEKE